MKCSNTNCHYHNISMGDNCSKGEPPDVQKCAQRSHGELTKVDKYHYHEVADRCHLICSMIDDFLIGHPGTDKNSKEWCELAQRSLVSVANMASEFGDKLGS